MQPFLTKFSKSKPDFVWSLKEYLPNICLIKNSIINDNQDEMFNGIGRHFPTQFARIVYNGDGVCIDFDGMTECIINGIIVKPGTYAKIDIPDALQYLKDNGGVEKFPRIVVIAGILAGRCISYVTRDYGWHLTDMYYNAAKSTPIPEMLQSCGRLCGRNKGKSHLHLHVTKRVADALYNGFHFTNEIVLRAIGTPAMEGENELSMASSLKSTAMNKEKYPVGRKLTSKADIKKSEFNLVKGNDGGKKLDEYTYKEKDDIEEEEYESDIESDCETNYESEEEDCRLVIKSKLANVSKGYYERIIKELLKYKGKWITKSKCLKNITTSEKEASIINNTSWIWHSNNSKYKNVDENCKGLIFKNENSKWYIRYN